MQGEVVIAMPKGARVIAVGTQAADEICLWALVKSDALVGPRIGRTFHIRGTGHSLEEEIVQLYIGTVFDGPFVWHVFGEK